ncbi:hypothetical protein [Methyloceanibacter sp.]|uniref:hypothetical protein n=1 Tax=Methyloceanibacter sp. TaxID=1965321 RepID=UPI002D4C1E28|nr:hypothetical protein [Methyloceanibacter sp.]HZP09659.1 hypothetical protein [Methyloceanibacter sp.]
MSQAFQDRILNEFLPTFCASRSYSVDGFKKDWNKVSEADATDFLRAFSVGLVEHHGRGLYRAKRSYAGEQFFWQGLKRKSPRPITLWVEPIITVAVLARLHFELGWPKELLGTQTRPAWAFDVATYLSTDAKLEYIACEVKKTSAEIGKLLELMDRFGKDPLAAPVARKELNAFRKVKALRSHRPRFFWAVGPGRSGHAFRVEYSEEDVIVLHEIQDLGDLSRPQG